MTSRSKSLTLKSPIFGFTTLGFDLNSQTLDSDTEQHIFAVRLTGAEPEMLGKEFTVLTVGLFVIRKMGKVRIGFVNRRQVLIKA